MIIAENICKNYEGREILKNISLRVYEGEFVSVMGKSGSGKSTLLNILAGNTAPDSGKVFVCGEDVSSMKEKEKAVFRRTKLGFVYQSLNLIPTLTARDNILLPLYLGRESIKGKTREMNDICKLLGVSELLDKYPSKLSGGESQRVAIAKSLIYCPKVIMLDEPTGSLDSYNSGVVMELLGRINRELGVTILQVTHDREAATSGGRIIEISDGRVEVK